MSRLVFDGLFRKVKLAVGRDKILYLPGSLTDAKYPKIAQNYKSMLNDLGVEIIMLENAPTIGHQLLSAGYAKEFEELRRQNLDLFEKEGITRIITNCSHCLHTLRKYYPIPSEHVAQTLDRLGYSGSKDHGEVTYHDPCPLAREGVTREPRNLLKRKGFVIKEPARTKEDTLCCGACSGLPQNNPDLANKMAARRLKQLKGPTIVTSCIYCYDHLQSNLERGSQKQILELSEAIFDE